MATKFYRSAFSTSIVSNLKKMSTVKDTIERYQNKLKEEFNVLGKSYNRSTIGANGVPNRKFLFCSARKKKEYDFYRM